MKASQKAIDLIKNSEGLRITPYPDKGGRLTIGYGHLIKDGETFPNFDKVVASNLLQDDIKIAEQCINESVKVPINQNQFDALVSFCYNIGCGAFKNSTMLKLLNDETA